MFTQVSDGSTSENVFASSPFRLLTKNTVAAPRSCESRNAWYIADGFQGRLCLDAPCGVDVGRLPEAIHRAKWCDSWRSNRDTESTDDERKDARRLHNSTLGHATFEASSRSVRDILRTAPETLFDFPVTFRSAIRSMEESMKRLSLSLLTCAAFITTTWLAPGRAEAGQILTYNIAGELSSSAQGQPFGLSLALGATFSGSFTIDTSALNSSSDPTVGRYEHRLLNGFSVSIGSTIFTSSAFVVFVENDREVGTNGNEIDQITVRSLGNANLSMSDSSTVVPVEGFMRFSLRDPSAEALSSTSLDELPAPLKLDPFPVRNFFLQDSEGNRVTFTVTELSLETPEAMVLGIPEPSTFFMASMGATIGLLWTLRRRVSATPGRGGKDPLTVGISEVNDDIRNENRS